MKSTLGVWVLILEVCASGAANERIFGDAIEEFFSQTIAHENTVTENDVAGFHLIIHARWNQAPYPPSPAIPLAVLRYFIAFLVACSVRTRS